MSISVIDLNIRKIGTLKIVAVEFFVVVILVTLIIQLFFATSVGDLFIETLIAFLVVFAGFFLVRSMRREIQSKDKIKELYNDLDAIQERLKILDNKKWEFLFVASNDLRDPLTIIKGYASMLLERSFGELSTPVHESVQKIFESSKHLITMISDFMDISNIETGDMGYNFSDVDMRKIVIGVAGGMRKNAEYEKLTFSVSIDGGDEESYVTVADHDKILQVVSSLIDNAIKYTQKGEISVLLSKSTDKKKIIFSVSDTGTGMSENTKENIFKKFSRADDVNKVHTEGTGLGLYVAYEIVKKHEGRIWAESAGEAHGSQFYVELEGK